MIYRLLVFLMICSAVSVDAQTFSLKVVDAASGKTLKRETGNSAILRQEQIKSYFSNLHEEGYLAATADSFSISGDTLILLVDRGEQYKWLEIKNSNVDEIALTVAGFREKNFVNRPLNYRKVASILNKTLVYYENHGYPFAQVKLDSMVQRDNQTQAVLKVEKGNFFKIDSVTWKGTARISKKYLYNYIGIKPGDVYNEATIRQMENRLKELPFVTSYKPSDVFLLDETALVRLYLNDRKASNFSGMVGFLPNNAESGKLLLTGEANLKLKNSLGRGESIDAEWRRLQVSTQSLNVRVAWPFIFNLPLGVDGIFNLYKRDTTFLNVQRNLGVQYLMKGSDYLKAFIDNRSSSLLSTKGLQNLLVLPDYADVRSNLYGLELSLTRLDYRYNPRKGIKLLARSGVGLRTIDKNPALDQDLYNNLVLRSIQYNGFVDFDGYIPLFRQSTINVGLNASFLSGENLFENELSRIGGNNLLRGFDEESIFASSYAVMNLEYRYLLEENSFLFLFGNAAWYENVAVNRNVRDWPYGFGAGTSFETRAGIFTISYALGSQFGNPVGFRNAKVHFGITSLF
jgi:outer membrane protein assembly factor BamA